jgi:hypothetical protein
MKYNDFNVLWFVINSFPLERRVENISYTFDWKDQGWGNRKGMIYLCVIRDGKEMGQAPLSSNAALHMWTKVEVVIRLLLSLVDRANNLILKGDFCTHDILSCIEPGDILGIKRYVGGGGGHELFVRNFLIRIYFEELSEAAGFLLK